MPALALQQTRQCRHHLLGENLPMDNWAKPANTPANGQAMPTNGWGWGDPYNGAKPKRTVCETTEVSAVKNFNISMVVLDLVNGPLESVDHRQNAERPNWTWRSVLTRFTRAVDKCRRPRARR